MLTLNVFGGAFGLPDLSPFVTKTLVLLKMSGLPFETRRQGIKGAPKGKLPWLQDGEQAIADSTFIRLHLEQQHGCDFSGGYGAEQLALAWSVEKMLEEHLYWLGVHARWADDYNFNATTSKLFDRMPWPMRAVARHQQVYAILAQELAGSVHALALHLYSPHEWETQQSALRQSPACLGGSKA